MAISIASDLTQSLSQTIADLRPGDMLLLCFENTTSTPPGMPADILNIGEAFTAVTPPALYEMDHPADGDATYEHQWQPWFINEAHTMASYDEGSVYLCAWILTGFTAGSHNITITYPNSTLVWGKVLRGIDPVVWGGAHIRAAEIAVGSNGQIAYSDFPHVVDIASDNALVLHVFASQDEYNPTLADDQPADYGAKVHQLDGDPDTTPLLFYLRTIEPDATSFTMTQPNMVLGDTRFFPSAVHVWYVIFYGGAEAPPEDPPDEEDPPPEEEPLAPNTPLGQVTGEVQDAREWVALGVLPAGSPTISSTKARTGARSMRFDSDCKAAGLVFAQQSTLRAGVWINHMGPNIGQLHHRANLFTVLTANHTILVTWKVAGSGIAIAIDNTAVATLPSAAADRLQDTNYWLHIGLTYKAGAGGKVIFWVNGQQVLTYTGEALEPAIGLFVGGNNNVNDDTAAMVVGQNIGGGGQGWAEFAHFDDLYVDGTVDVDQEPPPHRFLFSLAAGAGAEAQWTPIGAGANIDCVDDPTPNDDIDYVKADAIDVLDLYKMDEIVLPAGYAITTVLPIALAQRTNTGETLKFVASDNVNANLESAELSPYTSYGYLWASMPLAPDGEPWTEEKFNDADTTIGFKSAGSFT